MKLTKLIAGLLLAITIAIPVCHLTGCGSLPDRPPQTVALDSLKATYTAGRDAYKGAVRLWVAGKITDAKKAEADRAWNDFRAGVSLAVEAAGTNWEAPTTADVLTLKNNLLTLITNL